MNREEERACPNSVAMYCTVLYCQLRADIEGFVRRLGPPISLP